MLLSPLVNAFQLSFNPRMLKLERFSRSVQFGPHVLQPREVKTTCPTEALDTVPGVPHSNAFVDTVSFPVFIHNWGVFFLLVSSLSYVRIKNST